MGEKFTKPYSYYGNPHGYDGYEILIPNVDFGALRDCHGKRESIQIIGKTDSHNEMTFFLAKFNAQLKYLEDKFGVENVKVHWGLLNYTD